MTDPRPRERSRRALPTRAHAARTRRAPLPLAHERAWVALLLVVHAVFALWGAARQSVTFDENFHVPAGVMEVARGEFRISAVNPPLVKAMAGAAALAAGARLPSDSAVRDGEQGVVGESFMRNNADRYSRVFFAARAVVVALSLVLGWLVWALARRLHGPRGALVALGFYAFMPEALAHAGVMTMDLPTALGWLGTVAAFDGFLRSGRWRWAWLTAAGLAFTFLVRLTAVFLPITLLALAGVALARRRVRHPRRLALAAVFWIATTLLALQVGYLGQTSWTPLGRWQFDSAPFRQLQTLAPALVLPLPDAYLGGFDRQALESESGHTPSYLLGRIHASAPLSYFPLALAFKWPLAFLAALLWLAVTLARGAGRRHAHLWWVPALLVLGVAIFVGRLGIGIRYVFPIVPFLCVGLGGIAAASLGARRLRVAFAFALVLVALEGAEMAAHAPWHLSFFNAAVGGPAKGQWLVNDSNIDWGQGLIALKAELDRRGIRHVHLAAHGTVDPALYGIESTPYLGGVPGPESDYLAISSYYFVGLSQRMMTAKGRTALPVQLDMRPLWATEPVAMPAGCMLLFRIR